MRDRGIAGHSRASLRSKGFARPFASASGRRDRAAFGVAGGARADARATYPPACGALPPALRAPPGVFAARMKKQRLLFILAEKLPRGAQQARRGGSSPETRLPPSVCPTSTLLRARRRGTQTRTSRHAPCPVASPRHAPLSGPHRALPRCCGASRAEALPASQIRVIPASVSFAIPRPAASGARRARPRGPPAFDRRDTMGRHLAEKQEGLGRCVS
jgi:hypothetical protein